MQMELDGASIFIARQPGQNKQARPALFLHGVPDSAELWRPVWKLLRNPSDSAGLDCYAPDFPGFYRSTTWSPMQYNLEGYAAYVERVLSQLPVEEPVILVGHDWGSLFALAFACKHPERVARLIVLSAFFTHSYRWHAWARAWRTPILGELLMQCMNFSVYKREMRRAHVALDEEALRENFQRLNTRTTKDVILKLYRSTAPQDFIPWQPLLENMTAQVPFTVMTGGRDVYIPPHMAYMMHADRVRVIEHCGHWLPLDAPEAVAEELLA